MARNIKATDKTIQDIVSTRLLKGLHNYLENGAVVDLNDIDTSAVTDLDFVFCGAVAPFDVTEWDVSNVVRMSHTFEDIGFTDYIDLSSWDVSKVEKMSHTFENCRFKTDISSWKLSHKLVPFASLSLSSLLSTPSELLYLHTCNPGGNAMRMLDFTYDDLTQHLQHYAHVGFLSKKDLAEWWSCVTQARQIHAAFNSILYGVELGRLAWELRCNASKTVDTLAIPADAFEF